MKLNSQQIDALANEAWTQHCDEFEKEKKQFVAKMMEKADIGKIVKKLESLEKQIKDLNLNDVSINYPWYSTRSTKKSVTKILRSSYEQEFERDHDKRGSHEFRQQVVLASIDSATLKELYENLERMKNGSRK